ncbi:MAG: 50S ribosomal protein L10 [Candidatus Omnitrophota bacterium]
MSRQEKKYMVEEITKKFKESQSLFVTEFKKLQAIDMDELRGKLEETSANHLVVKNTFAKIALKDAGFENLNDIVGEATSFTLVKGEPVATAKVLIDFAKGHEGFAVKGGYVVGRFILADGVRKLALLPSREVLLAQVAGGIKAPISGFVFVLSGLLRGLVCALNQIKEKADSKAQ